MLDKANERRQAWSIACLLRFFLTRGIIVAVDTTPGAPDPPNLAYNPGQGWS